MADSIDNNGEGVDNEIEAPATSSWLPPEIPAMLPLFDSCEPYDFAGKKKVKPKDFGTMSDNFDMDDDSFGISHPASAPSAAPNINLVVTKETDLYCGGGN